MKDKFMLQSLQSIKRLSGDKLGASDGEIGHVKDFYFDDESWAVRYVVADTGSWLSGRLVLISPYAFGAPHEAGKVLRVNLTRNQIENCPPIEAHKPVSRQYEEDYYRYYGFPCYWQGDGLWGISSFPIMAVPPEPLPEDQVSPSHPQTEAERADAHLRSMKEINGYQIQASDGKIGHVCDFLMDGKSWAVRQLVVKTGHRFSGKEVEIPVTQVDRISYDESAIFVNATTQSVEASPAHHLAAAGESE